MVDAHDGSLQAQVSLTLSLVALFFIYSMYNKKNAYCQSHGNLHKFIILLLLILLLLLLFYV